MLEARSRIWWNDITGPSRLVSAITSGLLSGKNVVVLVPEDLPWRHDMRSAVENTLREEDCDLDIQYVDCKEENNFFSSNHTNIPEYLMSYATPDIRNGFRTSGRYTIQQYLLDNQVLLNRVLWVKGMSHQHAKDWLAFCKDYKAKNQYDGLFVIESYDDLPSRGLGNNVLFLRYEDYVTFYDALLFDNILVSSLDLSIEWKKYIATVMASLCCCDVQIAESIIDNIDIHLSPIDALNSIFCSNEYEERSKASNLTSSHPLNLIRSNKTEQIEKKVWSAQLQILFPLIEVERLALITRHSNDIMEALKTPYLNQKGIAVKVTQFGEIVTDPNKTELGTLHRLTCLRSAFDQGQYLLFLPNEEDRCRLTLLHRMRNNIAHGIMCHENDVFDFLNKHPYKW